MTLCKIPEDKASVVRNILFGNTMALVISNRKFCWREETPALPPKIRAVDLLLLPLRGNKECSRLSPYSRTRLSIGEPSKPRIPLLGLLLAMTPREPEEVTHCGKKLVDAAKCIFLRRQSNVTRQLKYTNTPHTWTYREQADGENIKKKISQQGRRSLSTWRKKNE